MKILEETRGIRKSASEECRLNWDGWCWIYWKGKIWATIWSGRVSPEDAWRLVGRGNRNYKDFEIVLSRFQFSSVSQWCLTLCNPMDCNTAGHPVHHQLPEFTQTHVHWVGVAIQPSHPLSSSSPPALPQSFPASGSFQMSQPFTSGGQNIVVSASTSVLPMNT